MLNLIGAAGAHARGIEVLDPQEPAAAVLAGVKEATERGNQ
jgi:hypothetical protein